MHPEAYESEGERGVKIPSLGVHKYVSRLEKEIEEKEREIEELKLQICSVEVSMEKIGQKIRNSKKIMTGWKGIFLSLSMNAKNYVTKMWNY